MLDSAGNPEKVVVVSRDITPMVRDRQRFENLMATLAGLSGEEFFRVGVQKIAEALEVRYAFAARVVDDSRKRMKMIAYSADGVLQDNLEFDVAGNACERVVRAGEVVCHPSGIPALFPAMGPLLGMEAESYFGVPLLEAGGRVVGALAGVDDRSLKHPERGDFIMRVLGKRASLELERLTAPPAPAPTPAAAAPPVPAGLKDSEARFRTAVEGLPFPVLMTDDQGTITLVNQKMEGLCGKKAEELLGRRAWPLVLQGGPWMLLKEEYADSVMRSDRTEVAVNVYAIPCRNSEGRISGTLGILTPARST
jgi:PAS domain S-box-containing protein